MSNLEQFRVAPGARVRLADVDPAFKGHHQSREDAAPPYNRSPRIGAPNAAACTRI